VALIHVQRCDAYGNAQLDGLQFMDIDMAMAATASSSPPSASSPTTRSGAHPTRRAFLLHVEAVWKPPWGAHRTSATPLRAFFSHLDAYAAPRSKGPGEGLPAVSGGVLLRAQSWTEYLAKLAWTPCSMPAGAARSVHMTKHSAPAANYTPPNCWP